MAAAPQPVPSAAMGQHAQTHWVAPVATTVVELVTLAPASERVPGSPEPWSPAVPCQGSDPSLKVGVWANAERLTVLLVGTQYVLEAGVTAGVSPLTVTVHQVSTLATVSIVPLHPESAAASVPASVAPPSAPESPPELEELLELPDDEVDPELDEPELPLELPLLVDPPLLLVALPLLLVEVVPLLELLVVPLLPPVASWPPSSPPVDEGLVDELHPAAMPRPVANAAESNKVSRVDFIARTMRAEGLMLPAFGTPVLGPRAVLDRKPRK